MSSQYSSYHSASWTKFAAYVELMHLLPIVMVLTATSAFVAIAVDGWPPIIQLSLLLTSLTLTQLAISIHNDYCDRDLDALTKPWRALPMGLIKPATAIVWAAALAFSGIVVAFWLGMGVAALIALGTSAGFVYNASLKRSVWSWLPFWIGIPTLPLVAFAAVDEFDLDLFYSYLIGAPMVIGIYLADTLSDIETDTAHGIAGLAHLLTPRWAQLTCWTAIAMAQGLAWASWPSDHTPGSLFYASIVLLASAVLISQTRLHLCHWLLIMGSCQILAISWLIAFR